MVLMALTLAVLLAVASMICYPGGTPLDHSTRSYSITENFLSDLGMTASYSGRPNTRGAGLFVLSMVILLVALGTWLVPILRAYAREPRSRSLASAAIGVGLAVCACFAGVAITPENRVMELHVDLTLMAWRIFPLFSVLVMLAAARSRLAPTRVVTAWATLTIMLLAYVAVLGWGPSVTALDGLRAQVIAQKVMVAGVIAIMGFLNAFSPARVPFATP